MEIKKASLTTNYVLNLDKVQSNLSGKLMPEAVASKILCSSADVFISNVDFADKQVKVNGKICFKVCYVSDNAEIRSDESTTDWSEKLVLPETANASKAIANANVMDISSAITSAGEISCSAIIELKGLCICSQAINFIEGASSDSCTKTEEISFNNVVNNFSNSFNLIEDYDLEKNTVSVLSVSQSVSVKNIVANADQVKVNGVLVTNIVTLNDDGAEKKVISILKESAFSQNVPVLGVTGDDNVCISLNIVSVKNAAEARNGEVQLKSDITIMANGFSTVKKTLLSVADMFSFTHNLSHQKESFECSSVLSPKHKTIDIDGNASLDADMPFASEITGVGNIVSAITNVIAQADAVVLEGMLNAQVFYVSDEKQLCSVKVDVPFSKQVDMIGVTPEHKVNATMNVLKLDCKARRGKEILIDCTASVELLANQTLSQRILSDVTVLEPRMEEKAAIVIYIVNEGDTIWDVAKKLNCSLETLKEQNENLEQSLTPGNRIIVYRKAVVNF